MKALEFKLIRESLKLTKKEAALLFGATTKSILRWERGEYPIPLKAAKTLGVIFHKTNKKIKELQEEINKNKSARILRFVTFNNQQEASLFGIANAKIHNLTSENLYLECLNHEHIRSEIISFDLECYQAYLAEHPDLESYSLKTLQIWVDQVELVVVSV